MHLEVSMWPQRRFVELFVCVDQGFFSLHFVSHSHSFILIQIIHYTTYQADNVFCLFSLLPKLLTGKIKQVKKQIEKIERNRRNGIQQSSATSTPKTANNREIRHKQELSHSLNLGTQKSTNTKTSNSDTAVESVDTENSDCELVEQPPDLIILDEDSQSSSSGSTSLENSSSSENSNESTHLEQENSTIESEKFVDSDSSTLFYEDREPSLDYTGPLYDSVPCVVIDSSNEAADATPAAEPNDMSSATLSIGVMPKLFTIRNENYDQNRESQKIVGDTATDLTTPKSISLDTPSVPTMNMRISVQPTEREVSTRTCTITSSAAKCPETINSSGREVLRAKPSASNVEAPFQPKPFQITIKNECAPSTSVAVAADCEKDDASASNILKRCREDSDVILVDESTSDSRQDDSVIFVSESMNTERPLVPRPGKRKGGPLITFGSDYIPVAGRDQESPPAKLGRTKSTRAQRKKVKKIDRRQALIAECRKQQTSTSIVTQPVSAAINNNDDEKRAAVDPNQLQKRMIIIDGSNVAFGYNRHDERNARMK